VLTFLPLVNFVRRTFVLTVNYHKDSIYRDIKLQVAVSLTEKFHTSLLWHVLERC
jgi:hypothetical protein